MKLPKMRMSADRSPLRLPVAVACGLFISAGVTVAEDDEMPGMDFLEYLGSWEESDEDWLILKDTETIVKDLQNDERSDPVSEGEESRESANER